MLLEISPLRDFFITHKNAQQPMVLATIVKTTGSTYKKQGAMMLINEKLETCGLLSGGCLEADIAEHAESVFINGVCQLLEYDLSDDSLFSLGAGCEGSIWVLLQLLNTDQEYQPLSSLDPHNPFTGDLYLQYQGDNADMGSYVLKRQQQSSSTDTSTVTRLNQQADLFSHIVIKPALKVCIAGAGVDAQPVCSLMGSLYWHGQVIDHRPGLLQRLQLPQSWSLQQVRLSGEGVELESQLDCDAAVVMSHNMDRDAAYLRLFYESSVSYIGLLGPASRRDKVLEKAGLSLAQFNGRLSAPVGLPLGGRLPEHIALSITAEIQQHLSKS